MNLEKRRENTPVSESIYRSMKDKVNSSAIKMLINDREGFVKEFIYEESRVYKGSAAATMGSLVHCLILEKEQFDTKYTISQINPPTPQLLELVGEMYDIDGRSRTADGKQTIEFEQIFSEAVQKVKFNGGIEELKFKGKTPEKILSMFIEPDKKTGTSPEQYYKELLLNRGREVVSMFQITKAEQIVQEMQSNPWVSEWINASTTDNMNVYNEYAIMFEYMGLQMKALIDRIVVNHITETVSILDIKSTWDGDGVSYTYLKNMWYIQAAVYKEAVKQFMEDNGIDGYKLENMRFLICDTTGFCKSTSYQCTDEDIQNAYTGFILESGKAYTGLNEAIEDILLCQETGVWNTPKKVIDANGQMQFEINYKH